MEGNLVMSIISVTLPESDMVSFFYCNKCGGLVKKYKGREVVQVIEAELIEANRWDELKCRKCKTLYRFL